MMRVTKVAIGSLLALTGAAVNAQLKPEVETGSLIPVKPTKLDPKDAGNVRKHFAQCVYHGARAKATALLDHSDPVNVDLLAAGIRDVGKELDMNSCLGREVADNENALGMKFSALALRDLMAEEAYLSRYKVTPSLQPGAAPLQSTIVAGYDMAEVRALTDFADCTIRADLTGADALVRTMPGSDREHDAAAALAPDLGRCLVQGQTIKLNPGSIRAVMAYGLWSRFVRGQ